MGIISTYDNYGGSKEELLGHYLSGYYDGHYWAFVLLVQMVYLILWATQYLYPDFDLIVVVPFFQNLQK